MNASETGPESRAPSPSDVAVSIVCGAVPGIVAGTQVAGLLFFLNPHLDFVPRAVAGAMFRYALLLGTVSLLLQLPFTWDNAQRARRLLPWGLMTAFAAAGTLHWIHASFFDFYLPAGINRRLIKAALWLSLAAVITFYTALLHTLQRRPYGVRSRTGFLFLSLMATYVVVERREAFRPRPEVTPRATVIEDTDRPSLLVVGVPGATLDAVLPMSQQNQLPFLSRLLDEGTHGRLETLSPTRPRPLWTSLATGRYPYRHGVVSTTLFPAPFAGASEELRLTPIGIGFSRWGVSEPLERPARSRTLALWEMVERLGVDSTRVGWPLGGRSLPTAPPNEETTRLELEWLDLAAEARQLVEPSLRSDRTRVATLRPVLRDTPGRAHFISLQGMASVTRAFYGGWAAVHLDGSQSERDLAAARVVTGYYATLDSLIEQLWNDLPEPRLIAVVSPYGTRAPNGLDQVLASVQPQRAVRGHRSGGPDGLFVLHGPGVRPGHFLSDAEITDVAPTLLYALGLPVARDLDGRTLTEAMTDEQLARKALTFVPSYETLRPLGVVSAPRGAGSN
ncbi:MAG: alkaline phosphatase family protein [Acidobacteriota bacterium]